jgi:hypothetical protein
MMSRAKALAAWCVDQTVPIIDAARVARQHQHLRRKGAHASLGEDAIYLKLDASDLRESHRAVLGLREQLQRRAQAYLATVAIGSSFAFGVISLVIRSHQGDIGDAFAWPTRLFLMGVVGSLMMSALCALAVLGPSELHDVWLRSQLPRDEAGEQQRANLIRFIQLNESWAIVFERYVRASYIAMRNGVLLLFAWFVLVLLVPERLL